uniref:Uncharacterized protein n=1 Tax=Setaria italica TaxID=4555 RepID=K3Z1P1_SETIT
MQLMYTSTTHPTLHVLLQLSKFNESITVYSVCTMQHRLNPLANL